MLAANIRWMRLILGAWWLWAIAAGTVALLGSQATTAGHESGWMGILGLVWFGAVPVAAYGAVVVAMSWRARYRGDTGGLIADVALLGPVILVACATLR